MIVSVYLHTILGRSTPGGIQRDLDVELPAGSTLQALLERLQLGLSAEQILLVVNGVVVDERHALADGDRVNLMPAMSGGGGYGFPSSA